MNASTFRAVGVAALFLSLGVGGAALQPAGTPAPKPTQPPSKEAAPAQPAGEPGEKRDPNGEARRGERMSVVASMSLIGRSAGKLLEQVGDAAKKEENLRLINEMQRGAVIAKGQPLPPGVLAHAADDAARIKLSDTYRKDLIALIRKLLDIETEIAEGKLDAAKAHVEEVLKMGDAAHGRLAPEHE